MVNQPFNRSEGAVRFVVWALAGIAVLLFLFFAGIFFSPDDAMSWLTNAFGFSLPMAGFVALGHLVWKYKGAFAAAFLMEVGAAAQLTQQVGEFNGGQALARGFMLAVVSSVPAVVLGFVLRGARLSWRQALIIASSIWMIVVVAGASIPPQVIGNIELHASVAAVMAYSVLRRSREDFEMLDGEDEPESSSIENEVGSEVDPSPPISEGGKRYLYYVRYGDGPELFDGHTVDEVRVAISDDMAVRRDDEDDWTPVQEHPDFQELSNNSVSRVDH